MDYLNRYKKMISLRGLTDHTLKSYQTYISAYLTFVSDTLHKTPSQVSYNEQRQFLEKLQKERNLSDRTINVAISQLRFFTLYVLHKSWDDTQLPMRKFDTYLPYVPSQEVTKLFISTITDLKVKAMVAIMYSAGLRIGEVCNLRYEDISRKNMRIHVTHGKNRSDRYAILSKYALDIVTEYWFAMADLPDICFPNSVILINPSTLFIFQEISTNMRKNSAGLIELPAIHFVMHLTLICMRMVSIL